MVPLTRMPGSSFLRTSRIEISSAYPGYGRGVTLIAKLPLSRSANGLDTWTTTLSPVLVTAQIVVTVSHRYDRTR